MDQQQDSRDKKTKERRRNSTSSTSSSRSSICSSSSNNNGHIQSLAKANNIKKTIISTAIKRKRISADSHEESVNYEEENDTYWSNDEGRQHQQHTNNFSPPPGKEPPYATNPATSNKSSGAVETSDEINHQSGESCGPSNHNKLRQHDIAEKRMEANRLRAKATRRKKKVMVEEMRSKIFELTAENEHLQNENLNQHTEIEFLRNRNIQGGQHQHQVSLYDFYVDDQGGAP